MSVRTYLNEIVRQRHLLEDSARRDRKCARLPVWGEPLPVERPKSSRSHREPPRWMFATVVMRAQWMAELLLRRDGIHPLYLAAQQEASAHGPILMLLLERARGVHGEFVAGYLDDDGPRPELVARHGQMVADLNSHLPLLVKAAPPPGAPSNPFLEWAKKNLSRDELRAVELLIGAGGELKKNNFAMEIWNEGWDDNKAGSLLRRVNEKLERRRPRAKITRPGNGTVLLEIGTKKYQPQR